MGVYEEIEARYGFPIPPEYRRMEVEGFFDLRNPGAYYEPANEPTYLWVPEAEWLRPEAILAREPMPGERAGFVPFAFTGAGVLWCWWPPQDREAVVLCPHDDGTGRVDTPSFLGSIYRRFLDYSLDGIDEDEEARSRQLLGLGAERLAGHIPATWAETLRSLSRAEVVEWREGRRRGRGVLTPVGYCAIVARDLGFPRLGEEFEWMAD
jgi:hypothetical protein